MTEHEARQEEMLKHLAEGLKMLAMGNTSKAVALADHVLALIQVEATETDDV